jgi:hypothetical protein
MGMPSAPWSGRSDNSLLVDRRTAVTALSAVRSSADNRLTLRQRIRKPRDKILQRDPLRTAGALH